MISCSDVQEQLLGGTGSVHELPVDMQEHIDVCGTCRGFGRRRRHLRRLSKTTQEIIRKDLSLPPSAWARIRGKVDESDPSTEPFGRALVQWFPVAAIPVMLIVLGWVLLIQNSPGGEATHPNGSATSPIAQKSAPATPAIVAAEGSFVRLEPTVGGVIETGDVASRADLASGHRLNCAPGTKVSVLSLNAKRAVFKVERGAVDFAVRKLNTDESFEVHAGTLRVTVVGTRFGVSVAADGTPRVTVAEGAVNVHHGDGESRRVSAGETFEPVDATLAAHTLAHEEATADAEPSPEKVVVEKPGVKTAPPLISRRKVVAKKVDSAQARRPTRDTLPAVTGVREASARHVIEVNVPAQSMVPIIDDEPRPVYESLAEVVGLIRSGRCGTALRELSRISSDLQVRRHPSDLLYLMGFCLRKLGKIERAALMFNAYKKIARNKRWKVPTSPDEVLPLPSIKNLSP